MNKNILNELSINVIDKLDSIRYLLKTPNGNH